jgi:hypothetical protein
MPDRQIARLLNRTGVETGHGNAWTQERVRGFRNHHDIAVFRDGEWAEWSAPLMVDSFRRRF